MDPNNQNQQPKNTPIIPLAQEIPQYRQAKLSAKNFLGPVQNYASKWSQVNKSLPILSDNINRMIKGQPVLPQAQTTIPATNPAENISSTPKPMIDQTQFAARSGQLEEKLKAKELELTALRSKAEEHQKSLSALTNQQKANDAVVINLKQQLTNLQQNNVQGNEVDQLKQKIQGKEAETNDLRREIERLNRALSENDRVSKQIEVYQSQIKTLLDQQKYLQSAVSKSEQELTQLKSRLESERKEKETRESQIKKLEKLLEDAAKTSTTSIPQSVVQADFSTKPNIPILTKDANSISGIIVDKAGKFIEGCVVMIKNVAGQNLRALKTNQLGQFVVTTSLPNSKYFIQVSKPGHSFDTLEINLVGGIVPPVQIQSHELIT